MVENNSDQEKIDLQFSKINDSLKSFSKQKLQTFAISCFSPPTAELLSLHFKFGWKTDFGQNQGKLTNPANLAA